MAEKRMFTQKIIDSDAFCDMPLSAQALYFHLNMRADDDGFVNNPKKIRRSIGASEDDLKILIAKRYVLGFDSGVVVIKHWKMHNTIKKDRYTPTTYQEELSMLELKENKVYTEKKKAVPHWNQIGTNMEPNWSQDGARMEPQNSIDKISIDKDSIGECSIDLALTMMDTACLPYGFNFATKDALIRWAMYKAERGEDMDAKTMGSLASLVNTYVRMVGFEAVARLIEECMIAGYKNIVFDRLDKQY